MEPKDYCPECGDNQYTKEVECIECGFPHANEKKIYSTPDDLGFWELDFIDDFIDDL